MKFFNDNTTLVSRAHDNTMKLWDIRNPKLPIKVWENLMNINY
jgi:WD40 repeat protein